jgi:hypothetical protein
VASRGVKKESLYTLSREPISSDSEQQAHTKAILGENDRSAALMSSAYVEHALLALIRTGLKPLNEEDENYIFFGRNSTLGTFASRTDIAYALGLISETQKADLDIIRHIRNTFAHAVKNIDFNHDLIKSECDKFSFEFISTVSGDATRDHPRNLYITICTTLSMAFVKEALRARPEIG